MHIYIDSDYREDDFSNLRLNCMPAGTHLLRQQMFATYCYQIMLKTPELSVVSGPRNVLRDKQGRLTCKNMEF